MPIDNLTKKTIQNDWLNAFPELSPYSKDKLYKLVGPLIIGIELIKMRSGEDYRPHFVVYSLWGGKMGDDIKGCLAGPTILKEFHNKKNLQFTIPYVKHEVYFRDMIESVKHELPVSLEGNLDLNSIIKMFNDYLQTPPLSVGKNSYLQALMQAEKMKTVLYVANEEKAEQILDEIKAVDWDLTSFGDWNVNVMDWFKSLDKIIANRDHFIKQVNLNRQDSKISKLNSSEIIV